MASGYSVEYAGSSAERDVALSVDDQSETPVPHIVHLFKHLDRPAAIMRL